RNDDDLVLHDCPPWWDTALGRIVVKNSVIFAPISALCVSSAKCPVSKNTTCAPGLSRVKALAPAGRKNGSDLPHTASVGGRWVRKYFWNWGYSLTLLA